MVRAMNASCQSKRFHLAAGAGCFALLLIYLFAGLSRGRHMVDFAATAITVPIVFCMVSPLAAYHHQKGQVQGRDASLALAWSYLIVILVPPTVLATASLLYPLRDRDLAHIDSLLHFNSGQIVSFANHHHAIGGMLSLAYASLTYLLVVAAVLPAILGRKEAKLFVVANLLGLIAAILCNALLPAIGPWAIEGFKPRPEQAACQYAIEVLRSNPALLSMANAPIVCFPSLHAFWALVSALALRRLRVIGPVAILMASLILCGTLSTGWHYLTDVIAGVLLGFLCWWLAGRILAEKLKTAPLCHDAESTA